MATKKKDNKADNTEGSVTFDLNDYYSIDPKEIVIHNTNTSYSNMSYIQINRRDVLIDFLQMPGVKREGKQVVDSVRVFMSHSAAQKLSEVLGQLLEKVHSQGEMEFYKPDGNGDKKKK